MIPALKDEFVLFNNTTHFIYGYIASDIWYRTTQILKE